LGKAEIEVYIQFGFTLVEKCDIDAALEGREMDWGREEAGGPYIDSKGTQIRIR